MKSPLSSSLLLLFFITHCFVLVHTQTQTQTQLRDLQPEPNVDFETNKDDDRFTDLTVTIDKGGCRLDCVLTQKQPRYYDGWFDSTRIILNTKRIQGKALIPADFTPQTVTQQNADRTQCPSQLSPISPSPTRGFVILLVLPPAYQNCSLITLSHLAKQANAEALLVSQRCLGSLEAPGQQRECLSFTDPVYAGDVRSVIQKDLGVPEIPVLLLSRTDGNRYTDCLRGETCVEGTELLVSLDWTRPKSPFEWIFWEPPQDVASRAEKPVVLDDRFYDVVLPKLLNSEFDPRYALVKDDPICKTNAKECAERCRATLDPGTNNLVYFCLPGFTRGPESVNATLDEFARRWTIYARARIVGRSLWWEYTKRFFEGCSGDLSSCSRRVLVQLGEDANEIFRLAKRQAFGTWDYYADKYELSKIGKTVGVITANRKIIYKEVSDPNTNFQALMSQLCSLVGPYSPQPLLGRECVCASTGTVYGSVEEFKECAAPPPASDPPLPVVTIAVIAVLCSSVVFIILMLAFRWYDRKHRRSRLDSELKDTLLRYLPDSDLSQSAQQGTPTVQTENYTIVDMNEQHRSKTTSQSASSNGVQMGNVSTANGTTESGTNHEAGSSDHPLQQNASNSQLQNT